MNDLEYLLSILQGIDLENKQYKALKSVDENAIGHTRGVKPSDKLIKARPNEPKEIIEYRSENFEAVTYGSMNKAFDVLYRIFNKSLINFSSNNTDFISYINNYKINQTNLFNYFGQVVIRRMIEDPNGLIVILPNKSTLVDNTKRVEIDINIVFSFDVIYKDNNVLIFDSCEGCTYIDKGGRKRAGKKFIILTKQAYYTYTQTEADSYNLELVYNHNMNVIPYTYLGGDYNSNGYFESYFKSFFALANEAIRQFSDWQALSVMSAYPIREEFQLQCDVQTIKGRDYNLDGSEDGVNNLTEYNLKSETKPMPRTMFGTVIRSAGSTTEIGSKTLDPSIPSVRFISPDIAYVQNAYSTYLSLIKESENKLNLNLGETALSGEAKRIDLQQQDNMLNKIFSNLFSVMEFALKAIQAYRYNIELVKTDVKVIYPANFREPDTVELIEKTTSLKNSNAPSYLIAQLNSELAKSVFNNDNLNNKIYDVISQNDPLYNLSVEEKNTMFLSGLVEKESVLNSIYSFNILTAIAKRIGENEFIQMDNKALWQMYLTEVKPYIDNLNQNIPTNE